MRILIITFGCDRDDVSEPRTSYTWVRELSKDHEVTLLCNSKRDRFGCVKEQFPDLDVVEWKDMWLPSSLERFRAIVKPGYVPYYIKARRYLKKLFKTEKYDIVHQLSPYAWRYPSPAAGLGVPLVRGPVAGGLPTPPVLEPALLNSKKPFDILRKSDKFRKNFDPVLRSSYAQIDLLMMAAPYVEDLLSPLKPKRLLLEAEHGLEESVINNNQPTKKTASDKVKLLFVGRAIRTKGLRDTIRALAQAKTLTKLSLTIVGDGEDLEACKREAKELKLEDTITFFGWGSREEVHQQYQEADIFICPTFREPVGVVFLEAMSHGLPSITCGYGGPDFLIDDESGIRIKPQSELEFASSLAKAIDTLVDDKDLREKLAIGALDRAANYFNWPSKRARMIELYQELIDARKVN
ncbi:MAG: glycosyltransferase family 4 protein [Sneathiella sp.]